MKKILLVLLIPVFFTSKAQDLTGIWRGHFISANVSLVEKLYGLEDRYKFEIQLDQHQNKFEGVTYSYKSTVFYGKAVCKGEVNAKSQKVLLEELKIVELRMTGGGDACIMTLFLKYEKNEDEEFLEGSYTSMNTRDSSSCGRGTVFLRKVINSDFYKEPFLVKREKVQHPTVKNPDVKNQPQKLASNLPSKKSGTSAIKKPVIGTTRKKPVAGSSLVKKPGQTRTNTTTVTKKELVKISPSNQLLKEKTDSIIKLPEKKIVNINVPKVLANRQNELVKTIVVNTKEITIDIYDNGIIDNDTVSVYLDKKLVISNQMLTEKAITFKFTLDESNDYHEVVMVAENEGSIPPNTSLMVIKAGDKRYEVHIASTEQKNAVVRFKYESPEKHN